MTLAHQILENTAKIVKGSRNDTHGDKRISFESIAGFWRMYLESRHHIKVPVDGRDVAQMMVLLKIVRSNCGKPIEDHFADASGYSAIAGELSDYEEQDPFLPQDSEVITPDSIPPISFSDIKFDPINCCNGMGSVDAECMPLPFFKLFECGCKHNATTDDYKLGKCCKHDSPERQGIHTITLTQQEQEEMNNAKN